MMRMCDQCSEVMLVLFWTKECEKGGKMQECANMMLRTQHIVHYDTNKQSKKRKKGL